MIGTLLHFTSPVVVVSGYRDPMDYNYGINTNHEELRQFFFDTQTNIVQELTVKNMEQFLKEDNELYNQFIALKKREKANSVFVYLRKYNEKHPLYLPVQ